MRVILRTHGGLGNQLFQVLYGRLYADKFGMELREVHDVRYKHAFPRSAGIAQSQAPHVKRERALSALRLPKLRQRLTGGLERPISILGTVYLDSYFQTAENYRQFDLGAISGCLRQLAIELGIPRAARKTTLLHLRLGDFFPTKDLARSHAKERLSKAQPNSWIITNDEDLLGENDLSEMMSSKNCRLLSTRGLNAEQVLHEMAAFRRIDANDSTMVFWACIFGGAKYDFQSATLRNTFNFFQNAIQWQSN